MEALLYRVCNMRNVSSNTNLLIPGHYFERGAPWCIAGGYMNSQDRNVTIMSTNDPMLIRLGRIHCPDFGPSTTCSDLCYEFGKIGGAVLTKRTDFVKGKGEVVMHSAADEGMARFYAEFASFQGKKNGKFVISPFLLSCFVD